MEAIENEPIQVEATIDDHQEKTVNHHKSEQEVVEAVRIMREQNYSKGSMLEVSAALGISKKTAERWAIKDKNGLKREKAGRKPLLGEFESKILLTATKQRNDRGQPVSRHEIALLVRKMKLI